MYYVYCVTCTVITFLSQIKYFKQNLQCTPIVKAIFFLIKCEDRFTNQKEKNAVKG